MKDEPRPVILLPYDFTEVSKYGVKHAVALAKILGYSITVLNVLDPSTKMYLRLSNMQKEDLQYKLNDLCNFVMQSNNEIKVDYYFKKGSVKTISEIAEELNVSFIVIGIDEPRVGSAKILKMLSKSSRPVFVVQQKSENINYKNFMFPLDDFNASRQKAVFAARLAKGAGSTIHIFSVRMTDPNEKFKQTKIVEQVAEYFKKNGVSSVIEYAKGGKDDFPKEVFESGIANKCDIFIIMPRGHKLFTAVNPLDKHLIFNEARIPVLCVNPRDLGVGGGIT
jgi:nucleotide-binding universal stress UspA family protein